MNLSYFYSHIGVHVCETLEANWVGSELIFKNVLELHITMIYIRLNEKYVLLMNSVESNSPYVDIWLDSLGVFEQFDSIKL